MHFYALNCQFKSMLLANNKPLTLQRQQSLGKGSGSWRLAIRIRTTKRATLQAPPCAAPLRSTNVTYTICTGPGGEFHSCGLV